MRMKHDPVIKRRATNLSLPEDLVAEARRLGVNLSKACEAGLARAVRHEKGRRWLEDNRSAIEGWNRWTEKNGLPLAKYRAF